MGESFTNETLAALDLSVKCGTAMSSPRTPSDEKLCEDFVKVECSERYEFMTNGSALRKRSYRCAELESISPPISSLDSFRNGHHPSTTIYRSESDSDSQYSPRYSPLRADLSGYDHSSATYCRNGTSPALVVEGEPSMMRNGGSAMYQMGSAEERTAAFVQAHQRTLPVPMKYVSELSANALNGLTHDNLVSLTKQFNSADILQKLYTDCSPFSSFPYGSNLYHPQHANPTSASVPAGVAVQPAQPPPPPPSSCGVSSGPATLLNVYGDLNSQRLIPPRKRFLAGIRNTPDGSGPNTVSPHSDTNQSISPPPLQLPHYPSHSPGAVADQSHASLGSGDDKKPSGLRPISALEKDAAYWERRRKNNEAAKRSRDIRRQKEEQIAAQAAMLSAENVQLKAQIDVLKNQLALVQSMMLNGAAAHRQS